MGGLNVKNTIVEQVLQIIAPHPCSGCGKLGTLLCDNCKYDIIHEPFLGCFLCGYPHPSGICSSHEAPVERAFIVSTRTGALEVLINRLKFEHTKAAATSLAELLNDHLPILPDDTLIIPVPTVRSHIRERGYDQVELTARQFAHKRNLSLEHSLRRASKTTQHTVGRSLRQAQSTTAFSLIDEGALRGKTVLLLDDIITTGSTVIAAAHQLKKAGATVWVAALAYQPLD